MNGPWWRELKPHGGVEGWIGAMSHLARGEGWPLDPVAGVAEGVVCLDSARLRAQLGRWTLLACCPLAEVRGGPHHVELRARRGEVWEVAARFVDPFEALEALRAPWSCPRPAHLPPEWPFIGGALGIFGYGCRAAVEALPEDEARWGEAAAWWGLYDTFVLQDGESGRCFGVSWGIPAWGRSPDEGLAQERLGALAEALAHPRPAPACPRLDFAPELDQRAHAGLVGELLEAIAAGHCYQGCATFPMVAARPPEATAWAIFAALRRRAPAPFAALLAPGGPLSLAGASPERFLSVRGGVLEARPMKGTRPRGLRPAQDEALAEELHRSIKDRAENVMIVDLMRNDLGRVCALGSVEVPALFTVETYADVHQMTSTVRGRLRPEVPPAEAIRAGFPPGSMTGAPKIEAMKRLADLEIGPRGWYSGVLGHVGFDGDMDLSVVIRSALVSSHQVAWHVGGGIVADSTPEGEWREALDKGPKALMVAWDADGGSGR